MPSPRSSIVSSLSHLPTPVRNAIYLSALFFRKFYTDRGLGYASILSYIVIITFVPLVSLLLVLGTKFIRGEHEIAMITAALLPNLLPETGVAIRDYLMQLIHSRESAVTLFSVLLTLVSIATGVNTLQNVFDVIWKKRTTASFVRRYLVLIGILIVSVPSLVLIAAASRFIALQNYAFKIIFMNMASVGTLAVIFMMLFFLYYILPSTHVPRRNALLGAGFATIVWFISKSAFLLYVHHFATYDRMYGSLSVIPVFLLWIYISAACIIAGCQFTYVITFRRNLLLSRDHTKRFRTYANYFLLRILHIVNEEHRASRSPTPVYLIVNGIECPFEYCKTLLSRLVRKRMLIRTLRGYMPRKDIASLAIGDILDTIGIARYELPPRRKDRFDARVRRLFASLSASRSKPLSGVHFRSLV
ncbi:MAG: YihY/virulence factor BrkB family protein [Spirochaetota bacterium]